MCFMMLPNMHKGKRVRKEKEVIQEKNNRVSNLQVLSKGPGSLLLLCLYTCNTSRHGDREMDFQQE